MAHPLTTSENEPVTLRDLLIRSHRGHQTSAESKTSEKSNGRQRFSFRSKAAWHLNLERVALVERGFTVSTTLPETIWLPLMTVG